MNHDLITAAEAALFELKCCHRQLECRMPSACPTHRAIGNLELEIAKAKRQDLGQLRGAESAQDGDTVSASSQPVVMWRIAHPGTGVPIDCTTFEDAMQWFEGHNTPFKITDGVAEPMSGATARIRAIYRKSAAGKAHA